MQVIKYVPYYQALMLCFLKSRRCNSDIPKSNVYAVSDKYPILVINELLDELWGDTL